MLIRDSLRRLLQLQIGALITDFVTGRAEGGGRGGKSQRLELRKRRDSDGGRGLEQLSKGVRGFDGTTFRISGDCRRDNLCRPIEGERGG